MYSHIAECECQGVNGDVYLAKYSFYVFLVLFLEVNACEKDKTRTSAKNKLHYKPDIPNHSTHVLTRHVCVSSPQGLKLSQVSLDIPLADRQKVTQGVVTQSQEF